MTRDHARKLMTQIRLTGNCAYERYMEAPETPLDRAFNSLYRAFDELQSVVCALVEQMGEGPCSDEDDSALPAQWRHRGATGSLHAVASEPDSVAPDVAQIRK